MSDELRPCPFCGKPMNVFKSEDYEDNFPWKGSCEGECLYTVEDLTKADVIAVISRRPIEATLRAELQEALDLINKIRRESFVSYGFNSTRPTMAYLPIIIRNELDEFIKKHAAHEKGE